MPPRSPKAHPQYVICPRCMSRFAVKEPSISGRQVFCRKCAYTFIAAVLPEGRGSAESGIPTETLPPIPVFWIRDHGQVKGPYTYNFLLQLKEKGDLRRDSEVSQDGSTWVRADTVARLFSPE